MRASEPTHSPTPEEIMEYLDGEGSPAAREHVAAHLGGCAECQAIAAEQRDLSAQTHAWSVPPAPASLRAPDGRAPEQAKPLPTFRRPARWILAGLSTAAAVLLVVPFATRQRTAPPATARSMPAAEAIDSIARPPAAGAPGGVAGTVQAQPFVETAPQRDRAQGVRQGVADRGARTPSIIRTARLQMVVKDFSSARASVESLVAQAAGFIDHMTVTGDTSAARTLRGRLRVPGDRLAGVLARLREMGQVTEDTQGAQDVTDQIVDLDARLATARATELRLTQLLRERTGRLSDVLEVERELTRVRLDIERLDAEQTNLGRRVSYATIDLTISEERKAALDGPLSLVTRIRIAAADGLEAAIDSLAATLLFVLRAGPLLMLWGAIAAAVWLAVRRRLRPDRY